MSCFVAGGTGSENTDGNAGVKVERSSVKDQLIISGNDVDLVSRSAALINQVNICVAALYRNRTYVAVVA